MIVCDVNVLVAAFITGHPFHRGARTFLQESLEAGDVAIPDVVWSGLLRTVTNPHVMHPPATWPEIAAFVETIRQHPGYRANVRGMSAPLEAFVNLCGDANAVGNKVSDAYIAAVAIDHKASIATWDADFGLFPAPVIHPPQT